jgi:membrane protein DedA with SNARE-associated domain
MLTWFIGLIEKTGYAGIAILMFLENIFPPIPSELIMPLAGFAAARGELNLWLVVLAGSAGSLGGAVTWYYVARWIGVSRMKRWAGAYGRWLTLTPMEIDSAIGGFRRHCGKSVLFGRLVPGVRTLISVPAGIAQMTFTTFLAYSALGTLLWSGSLAYVGYVLGEDYERVSKWLNPVSNVIIGLLLVFYLYRVATFKRAQ